MKPSGLDRRRNANAFFVRMRLAACIIVAIFGTSACATLVTPVDGWVVAETEHVRLRAELPAESARGLAIEMQEIRDAFASNVLACAFSRNMGSIEVTAIAREQFEQIARPNSSGYYRAYGASWVDYPSQIVLPTTFETSSRQVYQHELTHRLNAVCFPNAPVWLDEGLAKFLETAIVEKTRLSIGFPTFLFVSANEGFRNGEFQGIEIQIVPRDFVPSVSALLSLDRSTFYARSSSREQLMQSTGNYAAAWSLIHLLELGDKDLKLRFAQYINALHTRNRSPEAVWQEEFGGVDLNAQLAAYRERDQLPYVDIDYRAPVRGKPKVRAMSRGEAHLHWSWLLGSRYQDKAFAHASAALADASSALLARAMAAGMYAEAQQLGKAEAEVQKGLASSPKDARLLHAQLQLELTAAQGLGRQRMIEHAIERLRPVARTAEQLNALGRAELARGDAEAALAYSQRALVERRECWPCLITQAAAQAHLARWSDALESLELAFRWISHDNPDALTRVRNLADKVRRQAERR